MFFGHISIFSFFNIFMVLIVNSFPQNENDFTDSISLTTGCNNDPNDPSIKQRDMMSD